MQVELRCDRCGCSRPSSTNTPAAKVLEQISAEGPWFALGDGETLEDYLYTYLTSRGGIHCPGCGAPVHLSEEKLGRMSQELLGQW